MAEETGTTNETPNDESTTESQDINITVPTPEVNVNVPQIDYSVAINSIADSVKYISTKVETLSKDLEKIREITEKRYEVNKTAPKNYWDTLKHQYFLTIMQSILTRTGVFTEEKLISIATKITNTAINKMKSITPN